MHAKLWVLVLLSAMTLAAASVASSSASSEATSLTSLVGTWSRTTTCLELAAALRKAGMRRLVVEMVVGNSFIPNVASVDQLRDRANPCAGAVPRRHSHFFRKSGEFGSLDWTGQPVDDGRYRITKPGTVTIFKEFPKVSFRYRISGNALSLTPLIPRGCAAFRCAWAIAVAYPGKTWKRAS